MGQLGGAVAITTELVTGRVFISQCAAIGTGRGVMSPHFFRLSSNPTYHVDWKNHVSIK